MKKIVKKKSLHIVSFDVPYPKNYGGVIDVFYKLKNLSELGVHIYLHTFEYGRGKQKELEKYCKKVYYYKRNNFIKNLISKKPFIINTRKSKFLVKNLEKDNFPILFESLHTTYPLIDNNFENRKILIRTHNIEHEYYKELGKSETNRIKKIYFKTESRKLKNYEKILKKADYILSISHFEQNYFRKVFGEKSNYIPAFHDCKTSKLNTSKDKFTLWQGNLKVSDNRKSAFFIIRVFSKLKFKLVIYSSFKNKEIINKIKKYKNISFYSSEDEKSLNRLFETAHINALFTYQKTGIKLKLLNALRKGKFVVTNTKMIEDTGLEELCHLANTKKEFRKLIKKLHRQEFKPDDIKKRSEILKNFDPKKSARKIIKLI